MSSQNKAPWHQRLGPVTLLRNSARRLLFWIIRKVLETDDGRRVLADSLKGVISERIGGIRDSRPLPPEYTDLGRAGRNRVKPTGSAPIFITARFRTGSTLLWNVFRNVGAVTAYYEPFNERRFFDPALRGQRLDASHRGVTDYWREYDGLQILGEYYRDSWTNRHLLMDAGFWDPGMKRFIELLIERAPARPVLQFNRVDFRLPWLRQNFPDAIIVHLYRHPRDQWCSSLLDPSCLPPSVKMSDFSAHDHFYLRSWARDLSYYFPFLDEQTVTHPYRLFYYIWKLSYLFGHKYAHHGLAYEHLIRDPETTLTALFHAVDVREYSLANLKMLIDEPVVERWKEYAEDEWFRAHESACETVLAEFTLRRRPSFGRAGQVSNGMKTWVI